MSRTPPIPPAARSPHGPDGAPKAFVDVTHRVQHQARRARRPADRSSGRWSATTILALGGFAGFALGLMVSRADATAA